jgi:NAD(P)H-dependent FMN reductase
MPSRHHALSMRTSLRIVGLAGSLRPDSHTRKAVLHALSGANQHGVETELIDLAGLPLSDAREDESTYPPEVTRLREKLRAAHGIILGTPEYHGGYSGVLKNALDLCGFKEFEGKVVGLVAVSGGAFGGLHPMGSLRGVCRSLHAWVVPEEAAVPHADRAFDEKGNPVEPRTSKRLQAVGREVARFAFLRTNPRVNEFLECWETAVENPGAKGR